MLGLHESQKKLVLVVEDDQEISYLLTFILERQGYEVILAEDGNKALDIIKNVNGKPSLVLLDIMLPYHDGFELVSAIREKDGWERIPVIMLSAKSQENDITRALDLGADDYIVKPFQPMELIARLKRYLR